MIQITQCKQFFAYFFFFTPFFSAGVAHSMDFLDDLHDLYRYIPTLFDDYFPKKKIEKFYKHSSYAQKFIKKHGNKQQVSLFNLLLSEANALITITQKAQNYLVDERILSVEEGAAVVKLYKKLLFIYTRLEKIDVADSANCGCFCVGHQNWIQKLIERFALIMHTLAGGVATLLKQKITELHLNSLDKIGHIFRQIACKRKFFIIKRKCELGSMKSVPFNT